MFVGLMTGIGFGIGFWLVAIPCICALRYPTKDAMDIKAFNSATLDALVERNAIGEMQADYLDRLTTAVELMTIARENPGT